MKEEGKTVVLSEHRLHYLMDLADQFVYVKDGHIEKIFSSQEMRSLNDMQLSELGLRCTDLRNLNKDKPEGCQTVDAPTPGTPTEQYPALEAVDLTCSRGNSRILDVDRIAFPRHRGQRMWQEYFGRIAVRHHSLRRFGGICRRFQNRTGTLQEKLHGNAGRQSSTVCRGCS